MSAPPDLLKAIRAGRLADVCAALDGGASLADEMEAGLAIGMACFLGHVAIVRELAKRGVRVNMPDNAAPTAPLAMAVRGNKVDVVRTLIELGAVVPAGMQTGLSEQEVTVAQWIAFRDGHAAQDDAEAQHSAVEEIHLERPSHLDTQVLEADALQEARRSR